MTRGECDTVYDAAGFLHTVYRVDARQAVGDEADAAGRCNRSHRYLSMPTETCWEPVAWIGRNDATFCSRLCRCERGTGSKKSTRVVALWTVVSEL